MITRPFKLAVSALSLAALAVAVLGAGDSAAPIQPARAAPPAPVAQGVAAPGLVEPYSEARDLAATSSGTIVFIGAEEGDPVRAGQVIAEIDNADIKGQLAAAEARVEVRKSELERLQNGARDQERREAQAAVAEAEVAARLAKTTLERRLSLVDQGIASHQQVDQARADVDAANARRDLMGQRSALIDAPPRPEDVAIATANLALAEADATTLAARLEKTRLRSPIDGVLLRRYRALGETVSSEPSTLVATVGDLSRLRVRADVDEADVARVAVGQIVTVTADAYGDRRFPGHVARVGVELDAKHLRTEAATEKLDTKVLRVLIDLDGNDRLPVGLKVDALFAPLADLADAGHAVETP